MVKVTADNGKSFYVDNRLHGDLLRIKNLLKTKDRDYLVIADGEEGTGKSVFSQQLCATIDPSFNLSRMCMTTKEFVKAIDKAKKGQAICFDEAFEGLGSRSTMSRNNKLLINLLMRARQKNLFIVITLPTVFMLDKYAALWRAKGLFHIYTKRGKRGHWVHFNRKNMRILYDLGKKYYNYNKPRTNYYGKFLDQYVIDEDEYRKKKWQTLIVSENQEQPIDKQRLDERNTCFRVMHDAGMTYPEISKAIAEFGVKIDSSNIRRGAKKIKKRCEKGKTPTK